jgi:hypothetical protein
MMTLHGHDRAMLFDATFETNMPRVSPVSILSVFHSICCSSLANQENCLLTRTYSLIFTCFTQYPLYTVMVFDEWQNGIPVAFIITSKCDEEDVLRWLTSLRDRVVKHCEDWHPNTLIVDCTKGELNCIAFVQENPDLYFATPDVASSSLVICLLEYVMFRVFDFSIMLCDIGRSSLIPKSYYACGMFGRPGQRMW